MLDHVPLLMKLNIVAPGADTERSGHQWDWGKLSAALQLGHLREDFLELIHNRVAEHRDVLDSLLRDVDPTRRCAAVMKIIGDSAAGLYTRNGSTPDWLAAARKERIRMLRERADLREQDEPYDSHELNAKLLRTT